MIDPHDLDYEAPLQEPRFRWPPDWRRRLTVAAIAAPIVLLLTLEVSRRVQSSAVSYMKGGALVDLAVRELQAGVDAYVHRTGSAPASLRSVPEIQTLVARDPGFLVDPWGSPYLLQTINGKPMVISYARDRRPGGRGLDADVTVGTPYGSDRVTMSQFIQNTNVVPVILICVSNAMLVGLLAFVGNTDTREPGGLRTYLLQLIVKTGMALLVASLIASVHAPSGH